MAEYLWTDTEWNFKILDRVYKEIEKIAVEELGLDPYPNQIEIITSEQMLDAYSSIGLPIYYHHWSFGKHFTRDWNLYQKGMQGLAYEIVINSNPCISYLMEENTMTMQALVIAHAAFGHCHFFRHNSLFTEWTDASSIIDYLSFAKDYIAKCEVREGRDVVESFLDSAHSLMNYGINRYKRPAKLSVTKERQRAEGRENYKQSKVSDLYDTLLKEAEIEPDQEKVFPPEPEENILYFCEKYAPDLPEWKREIIRIVRKVSQYFYPQAQCLIGDTYVYTRKGMQMIKDIVIEEGYHAQVTDILSVNNKFEQTSHFYKRKAQSTIKIRTKLGKTIEGTPEHPVQVLQSNLDLSMVRLDHLVVGSRLVMKLGYDAAFADVPAQFEFVPGTFDHKKNYSEHIIAPDLLTSRGAKLTYPREMNDRLGRLFGYWVSEGAFSDYTWSISNSDRKIIDDILSILKTEFDIDGTVTCREQEGRQTLWVVSICDSRFREFMTYCGVLSKVMSWTQEIPWVILQSTKGIVRQFLSALFEGDGCNANNGCLGYTSTSEKLVQQVQTILCHFNIASSIRMTSKNDHPAWKLSIISDFEHTFMTEIGFLSDRKMVYNKAESFSSPYSDVPYLKDFLVKIRATIDPTPSKSKGLRRENLPYTSSTEFSRSKIANQEKQFAYIEIVDTESYHKVMDAINPSNYYDEIVSIEWVEEEKDVYDFTIPSNHLFISDCYVSHNTKIMNEGCATYVHYRIINRLHEKGLMTDGSYLEFLSSHTNVVFQPEFDDRRYNGINPYALGFAMMQDIARICKEPTEEDYQWFPDIAGSGDEMAVLRDAWMNYRDESFIRQFLSPKVIRDFSLFRIEDDRTEPNYVVTAIHDNAGYQKVRETLADNHERHASVPQIEVLSVNPQTRTLSLQYRHYRQRTLLKSTSVIKHVAALWGHPVFLYNVDGSLIG